MGKPIVIDVYVWTVLWVIIVKVTMSNAFLFEIKLLLLAHVTDLNRMISIQIFDCFLSFSFTLQLLTIVWFLRVKTTAPVLIGWKISIVRVLRAIPEHAVK